MAKPTKRILDWASGGTATDPGTTKEAAGWLTSERPPAFWWNWILQSFGDWLTYFDSMTAVAHGTVTTDGVGDADVSTNTVGATGASSTTLSVEVTLETTQASTDYAVVVSVVGSGDSIARVNAKSTTSFTVDFYDISAGTLIDPDATVISFSFAVFGSG